MFPFSDILKIHEYFYQYIFVTDPDDTDLQPSKELLDLYSYKVEQLAEIINRVYNEDDIKRLLAKLAKVERGQISVRIS